MTRAWQWECEPLAPMCERNLLGGELSAAQLVRARASVTIQPDEIAAAFVDRFSDGRVHHSGAN